MVWLMIGVLIRSRRLREIAMDAYEIHDIAQHIEDASGSLSEMDISATMVELNYTSKIAARLRLAISMCANPDMRAVLVRLEGTVGRFSNSILLRTGMNN